MFIQKKNKMSDSVYKHQGFVAFVSARLMAVLATQIQSVVVAWQVYDLTRDPMALALVGLAQFIPMLLLVLPAGDWIDPFQPQMGVGQQLAGGLCVHADAVVAGRAWRIGHRWHLCRVGGLRLQPRVFIACHAVFVAASGGA